MCEPRARFGDGVYVTCPLTKFCGPCARVASAQEVPPVLKLIWPVVTAVAGLPVVTVAVKVTGLPIIEGFWDEVTVVLVPMRTTSEMRALVLLAGPPHASPVWGVGVSVTVNWYVSGAMPAGIVTVSVEVGFEPPDPVTEVGENEKNPPGGGAGQAGDAVAVALN